MKRIPYTKQVNLRISAGLLRKLTELAKADQRKLADYARLVLEQHVADTEQQKRRSA